jgi:hypothetical protein
VAVQYVSSRPNTAHKKVGFSRVFFFMHSFRSHRRSWLFLIQISSRICICLVNTVTSESDELFQMHDSKNFLRADFAFACHQGECTY